MDRERLAWLRLGAMAFDAVALAALWVTVVHLRASLVGWWPLDLFPGPVPVLQDVDPTTHVELAWLVVPVWVLTLYGRSSYRDIVRKPLGLRIRETGLSVLVALVGVLALLFLLKVEHASRTVLAGYALASLPALVASRGLHRRTLMALRPHLEPHRVLVVGTAEQAASFLARATRHPELGLEPMGPVSPDDAEAIVHALAHAPVDEVHLAGPMPAAADLVRVTSACDLVGVGLTIDARVLGIRTHRLELDRWGGEPSIAFRPAMGQGGLLVLKRAMDVVGALIGLALTAPLLVLTALAVAVLDGRPILFDQERVGRYGRRFRVWKFRTMVPDAERRLEGLRGRNEMTGPVFKMRDDPRITRLGAWLRRLSLDELPQLVNVLLGDMSLVGPRPPLPAEVADYEPWQLRRLSMRPGLTCIWQVSGRSDLDFERWMALDLEYVDNWSLWLDLALILKTVPVVLRGTGAR